MKLIDRISAFAPEMTAWRQDIHANPEIVFDVTRTAAKVETLLNSFAVDEVVPGIGRTGVVGLVRGKGAKHDRVIGLRADMDALPIQEEGDRPHRSRIDGKMHACGHDGHTSMLLGAARYLAETREFGGTVALIFQPAEEGGGGAQAMVDDGLIERFGIEEVYGMHNLPGLSVGQFATAPGPLLASADRMEIDVIGVGGHSAHPNDCVDPIVAAAAITQSVQHIISRSLSPVKTAVISITRFNAGFADNVIPEHATLTADIRTAEPSIRDMIERRLRDVVEHTAAAHGAKVAVRYFREYPVTVNEPQRTAFAAEIAVALVGADNVSVTLPMTMGAEDFAVMLEQKPGCLIFIGNGAGPKLHHPAYDFNDAILPIGASYWARLVETALPV